MHLHQGACTTLDDALSIWRGQQLQSARRRPTTQELSARSHIGQAQARVRASSPDSISIHRHAESLHGTALMTSQGHKRHALHVNDPCTSFFTAFAGSDQTFAIGGKSQSMRGWIEARRANQIPDFALARDTLLQHAQRSICGG